MNTLGLFDTTEEIENYILTKVKQVGNLRVSNVNSKCNSETMFTQVLDSLVDSGTIGTDGTFIFKP